MEAMQNAEVNRSRDIGNQISLFELAQMQREQREQKQSEVDAWDAMQASGLMNPGPGQASVPMMPAPQIPPPPTSGPPPGPMAGGLPPGVPPPSPFSPPPGAPPGLGLPPGMPPAPPLAPAPPPGMPPPGWKGPSPAASPALGGPAGGGGSPAGNSPVAGAVPPAGPPAPQMPMPPMPGGSGMPMPGAGGAPDGMPQPEPRLPGVEQPKILSFQDVYKMIEAKKLPPDQAYRAMMKVYPMVHAQNAQVLEGMRNRAEIFRAMSAAGSAKVRELEALRRMNQGPKPAPQSEAQRIAAQLEDPNLPPGERKRLEARMNHLNKGGGGGGGGTGGAGGNAPGEKTGDASLDKELALDLQAWNYIEYRQLPYRKGTGGGKDANNAVIARAGKILNEMGMTAQEAAALPNEVKADAKSYSALVSKRDAIEGVMKSFHNNLDTWDRIAKGLPSNMDVRALDGLGSIDFSDVKSVNDVKLKIQSEFSDPKVAAYLVATMAVATDYARIMQGPQSIASLTEGARNDAMRLINAGLNDKARSAVMGALDADTKGQVKGLSEKAEETRKRMQSYGKKKEGGSPGEPAAAAGAKPKPAASDLAWVKKHPEDAAKFKAHFGIDPP
jgi:hypothetical protein